MHYLSVVTVIAEGIGIFLILGAFVPVTGRVPGKDYELHVFGGMTIQRPLLLGCGGLMVGVGFLCQGVKGLINMNLQP